MHRPLNTFPWPDWPDASIFVGRAGSRQPYVQVSCEREWLRATDNPNETYVSFGDIPQELVSLLKRTPGHRDVVLWKMDKVRPS